MSTFDTKTPTNDQLGRMLDELRSILDDFDKGATVVTYDDSGNVQASEQTPNLRGLIQFLSSAYRDGYRTSTRPVEGSPATVLDERGDPMPPRSDPVGELVVSESRVIDPMRHNAASVWRGLSGALGDLRMARGAMMKAFEGVDTDPGEPGCTNHAHIGRWEPVSRAGRCAWCYSFWTAQRIDAPEELLRARAAGKRITQSLVDEALRGSRRSKGKRR
jgi:hypothetical protein